MKKATPQIVKTGIIIKFRSKLRT